VSVPELPYVCPTVLPNGLCRPVWFPRVEFVSVDIEFRGEKCVGVLNLLAAAVVEFERFGEIGECLGARPTLARNVGRFVDCDESVAVPRDRDRRGVRWQFFGRCAHTSAFVMSE
jgi:hypothetical protein